MATVEQAGQVLGPLAQGLRLGFEGGKVDHDGPPFVELRVKVQESAPTANSIRRTVAPAGTRVLIPAGYDRDSKTIFDSD
jgi:hypothetical protein